MGGLETVLSGVEVGAHWALFVAAALVAYFTLRLPRVRAWLAEPLLQAVVFILVTGGLYGALRPFLLDLFELPRGVMYGNIIASLLRCLGGGLGPLTLALGIYALTRRTEKNS